MVMSNVNDLSNYKPKLPFTANGSFFTAAETFTFNFSLDEHKVFFSLAFVPAENNFHPSTNLKYQLKPMENVRWKVLR